MSDLVYLQCVQEGSKLRIKIISPGYHNTANCSFPKDIRLPGRKYSVPSHAVSFAENSSCKFLSKVYEDDTVKDCIICMSTEKDVVFASCGHYCACNACSLKIKNSTGKCPICRSSIIAIVKRDQIQI